MFPGLPPYCCFIICLVFWEQHPETKEMAMLQQFHKKVFDDEGSDAEDASTRSENHSEEAGDAETESEEESDEDADTVTTNPFALLEDE